MHKKEEDKIYIDIAKNVAQFSKAKRRKVGSIIVDSTGRIAGTGYNGTPHGVENSCETEDNVTHEYVLHSEVNAIFNATTHNLQEATMYVTLSPCLKCAAAILQKGFKRVVYEEQYRDTSGIEFLSKHGVQVIQINEQK